jgi:2-polyprenyl-6-methoxyphenol hydroxylase-like FAD-dependent oxidoreductase
LLSPRPAVAPHIEPQRALAVLRIGGALFALFASLRETPMSFDVITVGGGLAGSTLATELARAGYKVLVLERETHFKDRVRGANMLPWGVAAARRLGLVDHLLASGARQPPYWITYMGGNPVSSRDLHATTPHGEALLNIYHPSMQEALLERASVHCVDVKRGAKVLNIDAGRDRLPNVTFEHEGSRQTLSARVVVGADGRASQVRAWGGFEIQRNPDLLTIAGTLIAGTDVPDDAVHLAFGVGCATLLAPLGGRRRGPITSTPGWLDVEGSRAKTRLTSSSGSARQRVRRNRGSRERSRSARSLNSRERIAGSNRRPQMELF